MVIRSFLLIIVLIIVGVTPVLTPTYAQTAEQLQANASDLANKIKVLDQEIKEFNSKISKTQGEAKSLREALASLELKRSGLLKEIDRTNLQIIQARQNISLTQNNISETENRLTKNKNGLAETLRFMYYESKETSVLTSVLTTGASFSDVLNSMKQGEDFARAIREKVAELSVVKTDLTTQKQNFETSKKSLEELNLTLSDQKQLVDVTKKQTDTLLVQTKNKESEYKKIVAERKRKKNALEVEMLEVEAKLTASVDVSKLPKFGKGVLQYPVKNVRITQYFGNTPFASQNPQVYNGAGHNGVDFGVPSGTPLYSAAAGTVLGTGDTDLACSGVSYGKWVLIKHPNGLTTLYAHLSVIQVSTGQAVTSGQKIGLSGNTGYSTGPHLHFTVFASDAVRISGPTEYKSRVCGTYMILPLSPRSGYLNPLTYF